MSAAKDTLGTRPRECKKPWLSQKTHEILAAKEKAHLELTAKNASEFEKAKSLKNEIRQLAKNAAVSLAEDEKQHLETLATQLEEADRKHDPRTTWKIIRKIAGKDVKRIIKQGPKKHNRLRSKFLRIGDDTLRTFSTLNRPSQPKYHLRLIKPK